LNLTIAGEVAQLGLGLLPRDHRRVTEYLVEIARITPP